MTGIPMHIIAISGSLRHASYNTSLLKSAVSLAPGDIMIDITTLHGIPLYDGDAEAAAGKPAAVIGLDQRIRAADGLIIATPEYNFSMPGVLKNGIDWLSRGEHPFKARRVGVIGASTSPVGTARAQYHLRQTLQALEALVMPRPEIFVSLAQTKFDGEGHLTDETTRRLLAKWLTAFRAFVADKA
jgi:chromate reductase